MEKQLICKVQPLMKLVVLPCGQRALQGQTEFPCKYNSLLPKTLDNAGIVLIAPPRTGNYDSTEMPVKQSYLFIRQPYVVRALHWLKDHNTLYSDIEIEELATLLDDHSTSDQVALLNGQLTVVSSNSQRHRQAKAISDVLTWLQAFSIFTAILVSSDSTTKEEIAGFHHPTLQRPEWPSVDQIRSKLLRVGSC